MRFRRMRSARLRVALAAGVVLGFGGCISDQQLTSVFTSTLTAGLSTIVSVLIQSLAGATTTDGTTG